MEKNLLNLKIGETAYISGFSSNHDDTKATLNRDIMRRLMEMGVLVGAPVKLLHEAPIYQDPIAIQVRGVLIAVRRNEAQYIQIVRGKNDR